MGRALSRPLDVYKRQPYEIAPYAEGFPEVTIPYGDLDMKIEIKTEN